MLARYRAPSARTGCFPRVEIKNGTTGRADLGLLQQQNRNTKNDHSGQGYECEENYAQVSISNFCSFDFRLRSLGRARRGAKRQRDNYESGEGFLKSRIAERTD